MTEEWRILEINGGKVHQSDAGFELHLGIVLDGYGNAQIDDYGGKSRSDYVWQAGTKLTLEASFSRGIDELQGTAGFGFWNAPFGDPTVPWPALPKAAWFFFASEPNDLPLAEEGVGRGWFASTLDATTVQALLLAPLAPLTILGNQIEAIRRRIWPWVQKRLGISYYPLSILIEEWHQYQLLWEEEQISFLIDGQLVGQSHHVPQGRMSFVCWMDNQYMIVTNRGKIGGGFLQIREAQTLKIKNLEIGPINR